MSNKLKAFIIGVVFFIAVVIYMVLAINNYTSKTPVITPKTPVYAEKGETLSVYQLAEFEKAVHSAIMYGVKTNDNTNAKVSSDGQTIFVGDYNAEFTVTVYAKGENAETRDSEVTIIVNSDSNK